MRFCLLIIKDGKQSQRTWRYYQGTREGNRRIIWKSKKRKRINTKNVLAKMPQSHEEEEIVRNIILWNSLWTFLSLPFYSQSSLSTTQHTQKSHFAILLIPLILLVIYFEIHFFALLSTNFFVYFFLILKSLLN